MHQPQHLTEQYNVKTYHLYSREYLPLHIITSTWIFTLAKLLYKFLVPFTSTLAKLLYKVPLPFKSIDVKHLHIPIRSHIFQCQCVIGCYLIFQITIGGREIPTRGNTMPDCGGSGTFMWTSPTLCTMISCDSECLLLIVSHSHYHDKTCTIMSVQWQK